MSAPTLDHARLFDDAVAIARAARAATVGWRAICARARRSLGAKIVAPLAELDLDADVARLEPRVAGLVRRAPPEVDTLVFGLFDGLDVDDAGSYAGFHLAGTTRFDPATRWLLPEPEWQPEDGFLESASLDAILRASTRTRIDVKLALAHALRFGAAALASRFAAAGCRHRIVVGFDGGEAKEIRPPPGAEPVAPPRPPPRPLLVLLQG